MYIAAVNLTQGEAHARASSDFKERSIIFANIIAFNTVYETKEYTYMLQKDRKNLQLQIRIQNADE